MLTLPRSISFRTPCAFRASLSNSAPTFSGHNKWSKIQQKKGVNDSHKAALYSKFSRDIAVAARNGGSTDAEKNSALATVLKKAKAQGVPRENIAAALHRATQRREKGDQNLTYEAMAHGSVGVIIECMTDNPNRTSRAIKQILGEHSGQITPVGFMFQRKGCVEVSVAKNDNTDDLVEDLISDALNAQAEDFELLPDEEEVIYEFKCQPEHLSNLTSILNSSEKVKEVLASEVRFLPAGDDIESSDELKAQVSDLVEAINECEDTLRVWTTVSTN